MYDLETEGLGGPLIMAGFFDGEQYRCFRSMTDFLAHVLTRRYRGWRFFAHFGGRFDVSYVYDELRRRNLEMSFYCSGSCVLALTVYEGEYRWRFTDSYRLLMAGLDRLTKEFDVPHKKLPYDPESVEYNRNDCMGLYEVLTAFFEQHRMCSETLPSHALKIFRRDYLDRNLWQPPRDVEEFVRKAYTAGRCEIYRWNAADLNKYDVNSEFPAAMLAPVPVAYRCRSTWLPDDDREIGFYRARVSYPETYLPALHYRAGRDRRLYFPTGEFEGHYTSMELRRAIADGAAVSILEGVLFTAEPVLAPFIADLYRMKAEAERSGNGALRHVAKILMNSFYGKFGQGRLARTFLSDPGTPFLLPVEEGAEPDPENPRIWPSGTEGIAWFARESNSGHILPHISATVTARARMMQLEYLRAAGEVWYTDTDSIFTPAAMETSPQIGALKLEGTGRFVPYGLKEYQFADHYAIKGLPLFERDPATGEKVELPERARVYLDGGRVELVRIAGFLESVNRGLPAARAVTVTRERRQNREKRARLPGHDTRPWTAAELEAEAPRKRTTSAACNTLEGAIRRQGGIRRQACCRTVWDARRGRWKETLREEWRRLPARIRAKVLRDKPAAAGPDEMIEMLRYEGWNFADESQLADALWGVKNAGQPGPGEKDEYGFDWDWAAWQEAASSSPADCQDEYDSGPDEQ